MSAKPRHVVIVGFDGLRPASLRPDVTPNLSRFAARGTFFRRHRAVFPSETRVNMASLATGCWPDAHGILSNVFHHRTALPGVWLDTGRVADLERAAAGQCGRVVPVDTMGEALARSGLRLAIIGTGSDGATRLQHPHAADTGHLSLVCGNLAVSRPADEVASIVARFGLPPKRSIPGTPLIDWAVTVFLEHVWPIQRPEVTVLFFAEPDASQHYLGLDAGATLASLAAADAAFGRVLAWWEARPEVALLVMSDHGHVAQTTKVSAAAALANFRLTDDPADDTADGLLRTGHVGQLYMRRADSGLLDAIAEALMEQPWCGPVFARGECLPQGCLPLSLARIECDHAPDLVYTLRAADAEPSALVPFDGDIGPGAGYHGGLHEMEMSSLLIAAGAGIECGAVSDIPSGIVDIAPTVLSWFGVKLNNAGETGRVLTGAARDEFLQYRNETFDATRGAYRQSLRVFRGASHRYIDSARAWNVSAAPEPTSGN